MKRKLTTLELVNRIIAAKNKKEIKQILDKNRVSVKDSKYC